MKRFFTLLSVVAAMFVASMQISNAATASEWCSTATGHLNDANYGDTSSHINLTIVAHPTETNAVQVSVSPRETNTKGISFVQINGGNVTVTVGDGTESSTTTLTDDEMVLTVPYNEGVTSMNLEVLYANPGWGGRWMVTVSNFDVTATCGDCDLTENPVMSTAALVEGSETMTSAEISVLGTAADDGIITDFVVNINGTETEYTATDGVIEISGLAAETEYTATVYAKDRCNNVSDAGIEVQFTTAAAETTCSGNAGHFATPTNYRISYEFSYNEGTLTASVKPYDSSLTLRLVNMSISSMTGEQSMTVNSEGTEATYSCSVTADEVYSIYFLYGLSDAGGNEMTASSQSDTENLIYYKGGACSPTGIEETSDDAVAALYPNPSSEYVNVTAPETIKSVSIIATDGGNKLLATPNSNSAMIDIASLSTGSYIVVISTETKSYVETLLVK